MHILELELEELAPEPVLERPGQPFLEDDKWKASLIFGILQYQERAAF